MNKKFLKFEVDLDFVLIAITASVKDYRICYLINKSLNFNFLKVADLDAEIRDGEFALFSQYQYRSENSRTAFYFVANKGTEGYLLPERREADYFLLIRDYIGETEVDELISGLNRISEIVAAVKFDPKKIKSREKSLILAQIFEV